jgi:hypothetical protein
MKKAKKYTKKRNNKYTKKRNNKNKYRRKNTRKNKKKYSRKNKKKPFYYLKGGYADGFIPQVDFRPPGDPNFDDPFYQYQEGNDTCPFYPTKSQVKHCYKKHKGTAADHEEADACVERLIKEDYTETPGECNRKTCCDIAACGPVTCPPWSRLITRGIMVPYHGAVKAFHYLKKKVPEVVENITFAEEKLALKGAEKLVEENKKDIKEMDDIIEEVEPSIKIESTGSADAPAKEDSDKKDEDKKDEDKKDENKTEDKKSNEDSSHKNPVEAKVPDDKKTAAAAGGRKRRNKKSK